METLTIAGHSFSRVRVKGTEVGPTIARMLHERGSNRMYLQREGGDVIWGIPPGHSAADPADLGREGDVYVLIVEERGSGRAAP